MGHLEDGTGIRHPAGLTVVTLCRNNPDQLLHTLLAMPEAAEGLGLPLELLVLDGSDPGECACRCETVALSLREKLGCLRYEHREARGIYTAMNEALFLAGGALVAFMHSGDRYTPGGLTALVEHWLSLEAARGSRPAAVFGQAWIQPAIRGGQCLEPWLTPPATVHLQRWLKRMVPCHQAFLFDIAFARTHPYGCDSLIADRPVMREAIQQVGPGGFLRHPVCHYALDGESSGVPSGHELYIRLSERGRSYRERKAEVIKWVIGAMGLASQQTRLMRLHAQIWEWLCLQT